MSELLTIIIGTYNQTPYKLLQTIKSIENQNFQKFKIIIVDDNHSAILSQNIENEISILKNNKISYIDNKTNIGVPHVFRKWLDIIDTKYYMFYCEGDTLLPNALEKLVSFLENYPKLVLVHGLEFNENGNVTTSGFNETGIYSTRNYLDSKFYTGLYGWSNAAAIYRTELVKFWDLEIINNWYWDYIFQCHLLILTDKIGYINEPLAMRDGNGDNYINELTNNYFKINTERILLGYYFLKKHELYMLEKELPVNSYKLRIGKRLLASCHRENSTSKRIYSLKIVFKIFLSFIFFRIINLPYEIHSYFKLKNK